MSKSHQLRQILEQPEILVLPGVYDCLGAKIAEQIGFPVIFTSGFGISASTLGLPDYGYLTATETLYTVGRIPQSVNIPLVADLDTGYGNPLNRHLPKRFFTYIYHLFLSLSYRATRCA